MDEILRSWGPLIAALITGFIALSIAHGQQRTTLEVMRTTIENERRARRQEALRGPIHDLLAQLYFAKEAAAYDHKATLHAIAKVDLSLVDETSAPQYNQLLDAIVDAVLSSYDSNANNSFIERVRALGRANLG
ncbi:MAG: hypothetical protein H6591_04590 [Flavobacteriales bacterium]|nr:hypothetical protein [Flavobacteriales bacterium]